MIKEFNNEPQAKAVAESLGLIITKYRGIYIVSNSKEEIIANYNLGYDIDENIFYDKELFEADDFLFLVIKNKNIVDASLIELPYGIKDCARMFMNCTSLVTPPILPDGVRGCRYMFGGCLSLKIPPIIPEGVTSCYYMLSECASLKEPPIIPKSVISCTGMFAECTSLEVPPIIPESVTDCYRIFYRCTSLKTPPHFPEHCNIVEALQGTPFEEVKYDKRI